VRRGRCCCQIKRTFRAARRIFFPQGDARRPLLSEALRRQQRAARYASVFSADAAAAAMTPIFFFCMVMSTDSEFLGRIFIRIFWSSGRTMSNKDFKNSHPLPGARCENYLSRPVRINLTEIFPECTYSKL
jgi:hypothetical protein